MASLFQILLHFSALLSNWCYQLYCLLLQTVFQHTLLIFQKIKSSFYPHQVALCEVTNNLPVVKSNNHPTPLDISMSAHRIWINHFFFLKIWMIHIFGFPLIFDSSFPVFFANFVFFTESLNNEALQSSILASSLLSILSLQIISSISMNLNSNLSTDCI